MIGSVLSGSRGKEEARIQRLQKAAKWVRTQMTKRRDPYSHPSHLAAKLLEEADEKFDLQSFGVEGWSNDVGSRSVQYLNFGDTYLPTIVAVSSRSGARIHYAAGGWGPYAGG